MKTESSVVKELAFKVMILQVFNMDFYVGIADSNFVAWKSCVGKIFN